MALFNDVNEPDSLYEGQVPETGPWIIRSMRNTAATVIKAGEAVIRAGTNGKGCQSANVGTDLSAANFLGVAVDNPAASAEDRDSERISTYRQNDMVPVMMFGPVVVKANAGVVAGAGAHVGADDADGWDDAGGVDVSTLARFRATAAASALVVMDVATYPR